MRKLITLLLLTVISFTAIAQNKKDNKQPEVDTITLKQGPPESFSNADAAIFKWKRHPEEFKFSLYDRWGQLMVKTDNPYFIISKSLEPNAELKDGVYVYRFSYTDKKGAKHEKTGTITYIATR